MLKKFCGLGKGQAFFPASCRARCVVVCEQDAVALQRKEKAMDRIIFHPLWMGLVLACFLFAVVRDFLFGSPQGMTIFHSVLFVSLYLISYLCYKVVHIIEKLDELRKEEEE